MVHRRKYNVPSENKPKKSNWILDIVNSSLSIAE